MRRQHSRGLLACTHSRFTPLSYSKNNYHIYIITRQRGCFFSRPTAAPVQMRFQPHFYFTFMTTVHYGIWLWYIFIHFCKTDIVLLFLFCNFKNENLCYECGWSYIEFYYWLPHNHLFLFICYSIWYFQLVKKNLTFIITWKKNNNELFVLSNLSNCIPSFTLKWFIYHITKNGHHCIVLDRVRSNKRR